MKTTEETSQLMDAASYIGLACGVNEAVFYFRRDKDSYLFFIPMDGWTRELGGLITSYLLNFDFKWRVSNANFKGKLCTVISLTQ